MVSAQGRAAGRWTHHDGADPQVAVAVERKAHASGWGVPRGVADVNQNGRQHPPKRALLNDAGSAEPSQCVRVDGLGENNRQDQRAVKRTPPKSCGRATCYVRELGDRGSITGRGHRLCPQRLHPTPLDKATPPIPSQRLDASRTNRHRGGAEGGTQCLKGGCSHCGSLSGAPASLSASCLTLRAQMLGAPQDEYVPRAGCGVGPWDAGMRLGHAAGPGQLARRRPGPRQARRRASSGPARRRGPPVGLVHPWKGRCCHGTLCDGPRCDILPKAPTGA